MNAVETIRLLLFSKLPPSACHPIQVPVIDSATVSDSPRCLENLVHISPSPRVPFRPGYILFEEDFSLNTFQRRVQLQEPSPSYRNEGPWTIGNNLLYISHRLVGELEPKFQPHYCISKQKRHSTNASVASNTTSLDGQLGYAELLSSSATIGTPRTPWPMRKGIRDLNRGYLRRIPYCFVDARSAEKLTSKLNCGAGIWLQGLGGVASTENQHSLVLQDPETPTEFCCTRYNCETLDCDWNVRAYPEDALAIHWHDEVKLDYKAGHATLGYTPADHDISHGRHWLVLGDVATPADVARELGHVFGMSHEHQRWDRDDYVDFRCENLLGIWDAVNRLQIDRPNAVDEHTALDLLCNDAEIAEIYGSPARDWIKGDGFDPATRPRFDGPGGFDIDSIMMYDSFDGADHEGNFDESDAVLARIKFLNGMKVPAANWRIPTAQRVTPRDVSFVRTFYPWDEDRWRHHREDLQAAKAKAQGRLDDNTSNGRGAGNMS